MANKILKSIRFEPKERVNVSFANPHKKIEAEPTTNSNGPQSKNHETTLEAKPGQNSVELLDQAQTQANQILDEAQAKAAKIRESAYNEGWEAGYAEAQKKTSEELRQLVASIKDVANAAVEDKARLFKESKTNVINLSVEIARKIIGQELFQNQNSVTEIVAQAIKSANVTGACRIRVHPKDYEILIPSWNTIPSLQPSDRTWELVEDNKIQRGGCKIEADGGTLDAQIDTQLAQVQKSFDTLEQ